ncbi:hypothetical protein [Erwinia sp. Leaf53]|uniref:hypothetical protein n=1 Tax=Erwinia sp. Leaf53 TaxID=1736225 RepID=UPI0006F50D5F|nr:hypothetical protein [Erwinia sp. Leaf53]KQN53052.1 hypothetical protein ASF13_15730 [Erwinia sp. Leaf53]
MAKWISGSLCLAGVLLAGQAMAAPCTGVNAQVNENNNIILLGGTSKGPIKQVVIGEFGKDVNVQKRLLAQFDRCGVLSVADMTYDKQDGRTLLKLVQKIVRVSDGWQMSYNISLSVLKDGRPVEVSRKQGEASYLTGRSGGITSASDAFILQGEKGFTTSVYAFDRQRRLVSGWSRGSDALSNDETHYSWSDTHQLTGIQSGQTTTTLRYDAQGRELQMSQRRTDPFSQETTVDTCQLWDDRGNCTLSYSHQMELRNSGIWSRNLAAAYRFEYWDRPEEPKEE